jgi:CDP-glucose 4,6-dehydratase
MDYYKSNFNNKTVLITGHTGFKGSWLTSIMLLLGARVVGVSVDCSRNSHFNLNNLSKKIIDKRVDIRNFKKLRKIIFQSKPDYIFHLAAQSLVLKSYNDPIKTWSTNVLGTLNLLESLKKYKKQCNVVIITSDKCYLNLDKRKNYKETDTLGGHDPYSASKASAELLCFSQINSFFRKYNKIRIVTARAGNVIGGGDWSKNRIIPDYINAFINKKKLYLRNSQATRPWQHVLEPLFGYIKLAIMLKKKANLHGESFNFGPLKFNNKKVIDVIKIMNKNPFNVNFHNKKNNKIKEAVLLQLDCRKANKIIKWSPKLNFEETIKLTSDWYSNYIFKKRVITFEQIKAYLID